MVTFLKFLATVGTVAVALPHFGIATWTTSVFNRLLCLIDETGTDNTRGDGDDGVAQQHDETTQHSTEESDGGDVAVTDSREGGNGPVNTGANISKSRAGLMTFDDEHQRAEDAGEDEDEEEIDGNLMQAFTYCT